MVFRKKYVLEKIKSIYFMEINRFFENIYIYISKK